MTASGSRIDVQIKNTFIHFDTSSEEAPSCSVKLGRTLRKWHSDPDSSVLHGALSVPCAPKAGAQPGQESGAQDVTDGDRCPDICEARVQGLGALEELSCSGDGGSSTECSTPVHTPRCGDIAWSWSASSTPPACLSEYKVASESLTPPRVSISVGRAPGAFHSSQNPWSSSYMTAGTQLPQFAISPTAFTAAGTASAVQPCAATLCTSAHAQVLATPLPQQTVRPDTPLQNAPCAGAFVFTFTLRLDDQVGLGIDMMPLSSKCAWLVQGILPHGAVEAWNKQCLVGNRCVKMVLPGDVVLSVNGKSDCPGMLEQCKERMLLKMTLARVPSEHGNMGALAVHSRLSGAEGERLHASKKFVVL